MLCAVRLEKKGFSQRRDLQIGTVQQKLAKLYS
jgi:hypothetical protein